MRTLIAAALYTALSGVANAQSLDIAALEALREGDMVKLRFHAEPEASSGVSFETFEGEAMGLDAYRGEYVVLNFWATWCAPCRHEMPQLSALQAALGGSDRFEVVTIATGRNAPGAMTDFFDEISVENLPLHRDPRQQLSRDMLVLGLPVTVILDPDGQEIARLQGDADWSSDSAISIIEAIIAQDPGS